MAFNYVPEVPLTPPPIDTERRFENRSTLTRHKDTYSFIDPYRFQHSLKRKVVLITQAHRGIGRSAALAFAQAGASVCCIGPTSKALDPVLGEIRQKFGTKTLALTGDLLEPGAPAHIVSLVEQHLGPVDILVNITPASYFRPFAQETDISDDWWPSLETNLRGPISLIHAVLTSMIGRHTGTIISTTFVAGVTNFPFITSHSVSMAALLKFHQQLDLEVRSKNVHSYCVHPGMIPSHLHDPDSRFRIDPQDLEREPRLEEVVASTVGQLEWCSVGLASGTFVALAAEPRCKVLSGLYINAETDLEEMITLIERDPDRVARDRLYSLKVDEL